VFSTIPPSTNEKWSYKTSSTSVDAQYIGGNLRFKLRAAINFKTGTGRGGLALQTGTG